MHCIMKKTKRQRWCGSDRTEETWDQTITHGCWIWWEHQTDDVSPHGNQRCQKIQAFPGKWSKNQFGIFSLTVSSRKSTYLVLTASKTIPQNYFHMWFDPSRSRWPYKTDFLKFLKKPTMEGHVWALQDHR